MPQPTKGPRLGGSPSHQRLMLANLATSLFTHGRITTTQAKAKRLRPYAERLITKAKRGDLHNRREIRKVIRDADVVHRLIAEIGPFFASRDGGYTRITKTMPRKGDNAPMAVIELISAQTATDEADRARRVAGSRPARRATAGESTAGESTAGESTAGSAVPESDAEKAEAATPQPVADPEAVEEAEAATEAPYGEGSHAPLTDGGEPEGYPVKGNESSRLYHVPGSAFYDRTVAEVWFASAEVAEAAGFELPPSQRGDGEAEDES